MNSKVKCKIPRCGKEFSTLVTHLKTKHNLSKYEYLKRFPGSKIFSEKYINNVSNSAKKRFLIDPTMRKKVASRTFDFIKNKKLVQLLSRDYKSAKICLQNKLWKPSIILYGSLIETILKEKYPKSKNFDSSIDYAVKEKYINKLESGEIYIIKNLRNFIHLHKELVEGSRINEHWAKTASDICESIIKRFRKDF